MRRKHYILALLFLWWPVNNIHRAWNSAPAEWVQWYFFSDAKEDIQWYVHDICQAIAYGIIFWGMWLYADSNIKRDHDIRTVIGGIALIQLIDIVHYVGWHRHSEVMLVIEGLILAFIALKIFIKYRKSIHHNHG